MRLLIRVCLVSCLLVAAARVQAQVSYCFQSADGKKLHLMFTLIDKDWQYGYVRYNMPEYGTVIKQKYSHVVESFNSPGLKEYMWEELRNDTVSGTYQFMKQNDSISNIIYTRYSDKQQFRFNNSNVGLQDCQCNWGQ